MEQASYQLLPILSQAYRHTNAPTNRAWAYYSPPMNSSNQAEQPEGQERLNLLPINLFPSRCPIAEGAVEPTSSNHPMSPAENVDQSSISKGTEQESKSSS